MFTLGRFSLDAEQTEKIRSTGREAGRKTWRLASMGISFLIIGMYIWMAYQEILRLADLLDTLDAEKGDD